MKIIILPLIFLATFSFGQSVISSVNCGAFSGNNLMFSVGEIYVVPLSKPNDANSGLIGVLSRIEFFVTGLDDQIFSSQMSVFPNPASTSLFFNTNSSLPVDWVYIYDIQGRLLESIEVSGNSVDISGLADGAYFVRTGMDSHQLFKIIKQ
jgi:hypothetical protein